MVRHSFWRNRTARNITLSVFVAVLVGNLLCELGNLLAGWLGLYPHYFNKWFLVIGLLGMCGFGIALFRRRNNHNKAIVDRLDD